MEENETWKTTLRENLDETFQVFVHPNQFFIQPKIGH